MMHLASISLSIPGFMLSSSFNNSAIHSSVLQHPVGHFEARSKALLSSGASKVIRFAVSVR